MSVGNRGATGGCWFRLVERIVLALAMMIGGFSRLAAQTTTLAPIADSYVRAGSANQTAGTAGILRVQGSGNNRALLRFDQSAITAAIGSGRLATATLSLYVQSNGNNWGSTGRTVDVHRLTVDWTEAGTTWNCPVDSQPTNSQPNCATQWDGGSFEDEPSDSVLHSNGTSGWVSYDVTADVGAFAAGTAANRGWLVKKSDESEAGMVEYASREAQADRRPRLVLVVESAAADAVPPALRITAPTEAVLVNEPSPTIALAYSDGGSGVSLATLRVSVDQSDVSSRCTSTSTAASCTPLPLVAGAHVIAATLADHAGNVANVSASFQLLLGAGPHTSTLGAVADTTLRGGERNQGFGSAASLDVRQSGPRRALVRFDQPALASLLQGGQLLSAALEVYLEGNGNNWGTSGRPVAVHRLTAPWTESTATWNCATDTQPTNSQPDCGSQWGGGSYAAAATSSVVHTKGLVGWVRFDVTADVQTFLGGTANQGWIVRKVDEGASGFAAYASREGTAGRAPRLVLVFTTPTVTDAIPPTISTLRPVDHSFTGSRRPTVSAAYSDNGAGVNLSTVKMAIDGVDRTAGANVSAGAVTFTPGADLAEGEHHVALEVRDHAGNASTAAWAFVVDTTPPAVSFASPAGDLLVQDPTVEVSITFDETASGVRADTFHLLVDGADATASCRKSGHEAFCLTAPLASGTHSLTAAVADWVGNQGSGSRSFLLHVDHQAPQLTIDAPQEGAVSAQPQVEVRGAASDDGQLDGVLVQGTAAAVANGHFTALVDLVDGANTIGVMATDSFGNSTTAAVNVVLDRVPPTIELTSPLADQVVVVDAVHVDGFVDDAYGVAAATVNGSPATLTEGRFSSLLGLADGANEVVVAAVDRAGNHSERRVTVTRFSVPDVQISSPADLSFLAATTITVAGTVSDPAVEVAVNGVSAVVSGTTFSAAGVPLIEGGNTVTATARDAHGHVATDTIMVVRDLTAPRVEVYSPVDGAEVTAGTVTVRGLVNDIVPGTVNAGEVTVTVNDHPAQVVNRSFLAAAVLLAEGDNLLQVVAVDESGNRGERTLTVYRTAGGYPRLVAVSGDGQTAAIGARLTDALVVELRDDSGAPAAGKPVAFRVTRGNGTLDEGRRSLVATTDAAGRARVFYSLGTRAGVANHVVEASAPGFGAPVSWTASATPGPPALLVVDSGGLQVGVAGRDLPRPLVAAVIDRGSNRLDVVPVTFRVTLGNGRFADGSQEKVVLTDSDGRAITTFTLGEAEGIANNVVEASLADGIGGKVGFVASGRMPGDPAATSVSGVVLDNTNQPLEGVTLRIKETTLTAVSDAQGQFRITGVSPGGIKLVVDGSTALAPGPWPDLEFDLVTIAGRDTTVNMPIYLVPLELGNGVYVDEVNGNTVTLPDYPGFALEIPAGSVTFPGGSRSGVVSVTVVHNDKVPMVPNFGQQPRFIVTIQPAGARFDPPARLTLPNVDGLAPGSATEMYSFDHDLGHFVSIGPASVSNDGTVIRSDPGVGIVKAGWHCGGDPPPDGSGYQCPDGFFCNGTTCEPESCPRGVAQGNDLALGEKAGGGACKPDGCYPNATCSNGCRGPRLQITGARVEGRPASRPDLPLRQTLVPVELKLEPLDPVNIQQAVVELRATPSIQPAGACQNATVRWSFGDGTPDEDHALSGGVSTVTHTYTCVSNNSCANNSGFPVTVTVKCPACAAATGAGRIVVSTYEVAMRLERLGPITISDDGDYFEEAKVKITAVNSETGDPVTTFNGDVELADVTPDRPIYHPADNGEVPGTAHFTDSARGVVELTLRSRAGARDGARPPKAKISTPPFEVFGGEDLEIPQWVSEPVDGLWHGGERYAWMQAMLRDIRRDNAGGNVGNVIGTVAGYEIVDSLDSSAGGGPQLCGFTPRFDTGEPDDVIHLAATCGSFRTNGASSNPCGGPTAHGLTTMFIHEARHAYQHSLQRDVSINHDRDRLVTRIDIPPAELILDSDASRPICNSGVFSETFFQGDGAFDDDPPECRTVTALVCFVTNAVEWDAYKFARDGQ